MKEKYDFSKGKRGAIDPVPSGKTRVSVPLDDDILEWFRNQVNASGGGNYQLLINNALRDYISNRKESLEVVLRRVLREEMSVPRKAHKSKRVKVA